MATLDSARSSGKPVASRWDLRLLTWGAEALALGLFWWVCSLMSVERASVLGEKLAVVFGPRFPKKDDIIRRNFERVFPEKDPGEIEALTRGVWRNFGQVFAEYAHLKTFAGATSKTGGTPRVEVVGATEALRRTDGPSIFVTAHMANWELATLPAKVLSVPLSVVYAPEPNWIAQGMMQNKRRALGCECIANTDGLPAIARALAEGRSLGFVMDRRLKQGELSPFFGTDTFMSTVPARLALKFGCDLVPVRVERLRRGYYRVMVQEAVRPEDSITNHRKKALDMTRQVSQRFESWIRERPDQWFCSKRMWPKPPKGER